MLCSHGVLSGVGSGVGSEKLNMFNNPDSTPNSDPDISVHTMILSTGRSGRSAGPFAGQYHRVNTILFATLGQNERDRRVPSIAKTHLTSDVDKH